MSDLSEVDVDVRRIIAGIARKPMTIGDTLPRTRCGNNAA